MAANNEPQSKLKQVKDFFLGLAILIVIGTISWNWLASDNEAAPVEAEAAVVLSPEQQAEATRLAEEARVAKAEEEARERALGFHCLSSWDGSHRGLVDQVKRRLNDPRSFEHDQTNVWPVRPDGRNQIVMTYRAKNGFGALILAKAVGTFDNQSCDISVDKID